MRPNPISKKYRSKKKSGKTLWYPTNGGHYNPWSNICACCSPNKKELLRLHKDRKKFGYDRKHKKRQNIKYFM